ncbi:hypothetical protein ACE6H2_004845 [Prunus campanulata]
MMENSWKTKCSSTLQSSALSMASSSSQEHRNRMETNTGYYSYPHGSQDLRPTMIGRLQDPLLASKLYSGSHRSEHANSGNSFLALLSGSPSVFQCDFQELSNPKPISTSCKILPDSNNFIGNGIGSAIPVTSSGVLSENLRGQNLQSGAASCTKVSSRSVPSSSCASNSVLHDLQSSDLAKVVTRNMVLGSEKVKGSFSLSGEWRGVSPADTGKACGENIQTSKKLPVEGNFVISNQASSFMNGCPRVFCSTTSGYLLLSNTGLVGIVCSCHCLHMSVLKFCEHSGLYGVNPGDAVRMDNGETIAQWCKLYFLNSGIRVPGDRSEWDWPEGLSATAGLVKSSMSMPNISNDLSHMVHSSGGSASSQQSLDGVALSKNLFTNQNLVVGAVENKQQRNIQDGNTIFLKGFTGTPQSNFHGMADNLILERPMSMSKLVGSGLQDGGQSVSAYIESMKNGNSSITDPSLKDRRITGKESNFCRTVNAKDGAFRDAAISNIELRLGQPYQLGQSSGNSNLPAVGPQLLDTLVHPLKSLFPEQMIPNTNCREEMEFRQSLYFSAVPSPITKRDHKQLNRGNNSFVIGNVIDAARVEKSTSNLGQDSVISFLTNLNAPPEDNSRPKANKYICNVGEHAMQNALHYEPQSAKYGFANVPRNGSNSVERQLDMSQLGSYRLIDKAKGVSFVTDDSHLSKDLGFRIRKEMEISSSFNGLSGTSDPCFLTAHKNSCYSHQLSGVAPDGSDSRKYSNFPDKVLYFGNRGQVGHVNHRPMASSVGSGLIFPSQTVSKGIPPVSASISVSDQTPAASRENLIEVSAQLPDDNSRLLALREIMELSKQHHALPSLPMNRGKGIFDCSSYMQNSLVDTSASGKQERKLSLTSKNAVSEATIKSHQSGASCRNGSDEGFTSLTGVNTCCHFSTLKQGNALHSKEVDLKHQISFVPLCNEQPSLRSGKNIIEPSEHERCCHKVPYGYFRGSCSCAASINCLGRDFESRVGCFPDAFKEQMGTVNGEASMIFAPKFANNHIVPKDKTTSLDPRGQVNGKILKNVCHASQWRDVPSKVKGVSDVTRVDRLANLFDARRRDSEQLGDNYVNHFNGTVQMVDSSKEHEIYNNSSGGSAPAVTQASIEVNKMDSSTIDAGDTGCVSNLIVDEGSGVDKCWSSDDALESEKSAEFLTSTGNTSLRKVGSFKNLNHQSSCSLLDELKLLNSLTWLKGQNKLPAGLALHEKDEYPQNFERGLEDGKKKREIGSESCPTSGPYTVQEENPECNDSAQFPSCPSKSVKTLFPLRQSKTLTFGTCVTQHSSKPRLPKCSAKKLSRKRDLRRLYDDNDREVNDVNQRELNGGTDNCEISEVSGGKKCKRDFSSNGFRQFLTRESGHEGARKRKHNSVGLKSCSSQQVNICYRKARPIVCGKYGELANGNLDGDVPKPAKVVPLSRVLNSARRCTLPKNCNPKSTSMRELKKTSPNGAVVSSDVCHNDTGCGKINDTPVEKAKKECSVGDKKIRKELTKLEHLGDDQSEKDHSKLGGIAHAQLKLKSKEIRKRSIYELTDKGKDPSFDSSSFSKISNCLPAKKEGKLLKTAEDSKLGLCKLSSKSSTLEHQCHSDLDSDAFCCVCGSSNKDEINNLLTCSQCSIKVHQACYGVSKLPKGHWCCRPCRTSSKDIVCVLCGYGGGAMTQALRSRTVVKSLLRAWNAETECMAKNKLSSVKTLQKDSSGLHCSGYGHQDNSSFFVLQRENGQPLVSAVCKMGMSYKFDVMHNSITVGLLDSATKQWVHMVCGLWTPGTRCPNVDTMSAFDVSGAHPRADVVCCICKRAGGSCIQCRVANCSAQFHPWCAHQKGLLQSELEGVENENIGFYGICVLHATHPTCESNHDPVNTEAGCIEEEELMCARTEGYKGRKRDGFRHNYCNQSKGNGGCLVPQEQLNAWVHINGQKSSTQGLPKLPVSDIEHDCRKEYARYKQAKFWKHLVVYKSGIHALGLYTSRFISRSEMVVEYVGEIVGLRVADKRENEYQSGKKLQYKSACYFFRIDKEHIIDATCKGGIARFVNHSCVPNCVAKVISVRNEKKVVFFAERDIFPGEEITYDYHFNHEDEGKKIPCFCNSKNCRRYLN